MTGKNKNLVPIFIPRRFKGDDVRTVSVNGKYKQIPTGKQFFVERCFAEVVANSILAENNAEIFKSQAAK